MRILHTADWHVGKVLRGRHRLDEHEAVLGDIVNAAREEDVDLVLVAGDVFDTSAPTPDAQQLAMRTLLDLNQDGRKVIVEAGNHDNPRQLDVFRPILGQLGIVVVGLPLRPADGGQLEVTLRTGEPARVAVLPFVSQRNAISASQAMSRTAAETNRDYADNVKAMVDALTAGFDRPGAVNLLMTHATLIGGTAGGGERQSQIFDYAVSAPIFPSTLHYVALGHLHRRQTIPGPAPLNYCGAPLQVDFGETENEPVVVIVEVTADTPAVTRDRVVKGGRRLRTVRGTLSELAALSVGDQDWLRVVVRERQHAGLSDEVRDLLPGALDVVVDDEFRVHPTTARRATGDGSRGPVELFEEYLKSRERGDVAVLTKRFAAILDELQQGTGQQESARHETVV